MPFNVLTLPDRLRLEDLCDRALALHGAPTDAEEYRSIQEVLLEVTLRVEGELRALRSSSGSLRRSFSLGPRKSREEAREAKSSLSTLEHSIAGNENVRRMLRGIGDTVAFALLDAWDIKPLSFKEDSGYVSGKDGLDVELDIFQLCFDHGAIGLLNDLTSCLRHGDVTCVNPRNGRFAVIEAKSRKGRSPRTVRQEAAARKILSWLTTDEADGLYGLEGKFVRQAFKSHPRYHTQFMSDLVERGCLANVAIESPESGLVYLAATEVTEEDVRRSKDYCRGTPLVSVLDGATPWPLGHRPASLLVGSGRRLAEFLSGHIIIAVILDSEVLVRGFRELGLEVTFTPDSDRPILLRHPPVLGIDGPEVSIGEHIFQRLFTEALSLEWFIHELGQLPPLPTHE